MVKRFVPMASVIFITFFIFSCAATLKDYQPKSPDEAEIKGLLMNYDNTWNNKDEAGFLSLWHDKAELTYGRDRITVSKQEYAKIIKQRMEAFPVHELGSPKVKIEGNKATVKVPQMVQGGYISMTFDLVREDKWFFMSNKY